MNELVAKIMEALLEFIINSEAFKKKVISIAEDVSVGEDDVLETIRDYTNNNSDFAGRIGEIVGEEKDTRDERFENRVKDVVENMTFETTARSY